VDRKKGVKVVASILYKNKERPVFDIDFNRFREFMIRKYKHIKVPEPSDFKQHFSESRNREWRITKYGERVPNVPYFCKCGSRDDSQYACLTLECHPTPMPPEEKILPTPMPPEEKIESVLKSSEEPVSPLLEDVDMNWKDFFDGLG